jgi:hypothetical protein
MGLWWWYTYSPFYFPRPTFLPTALPQSLFSSFILTWPLHPFQSNIALVSKKEKELINTQAPMSTTTTTTETKNESQTQTKAQNGAEQQTRHSEVGHKSLLQSDALYQVRTQA